MNKWIIKPDVYREKEVCLESMFKMISNDDGLDTKFNSSVLFSAVTEIHRKMHFLSTQFGFSLCINTMNRQISIYCLWFFF